MPEWITDASFWSGFVVWAGAAVAALAIWSARLSNEEANEKDRALKKYQSEAAVLIATANERAEKANKEAEQARLEHEKLKSKLAWRIIPKSDLDVMLPILSSTPSEVKIAWVSGDTETQLLAGQLINVFNKAGWKTHAARRTYLNGSILFGNFVAGDSPEASLVRRAFDAVNSEYSNNEKAVASELFSGEYSAPVTILIAPKLPFDPMGQLMLPSSVPAANQAAR